MVTRALESTFVKSDQIPQMAGRVPILLGLRPQRSLGPDPKGPMARFRTPQSSREDCLAPAGRGLDLPLAPGYVTAIISGFFRSEIIPDSDP